MKIINDISDFIFVEDKPEKSDVIFIPGGSHPQLGERAAELWNEGFAPFVMPSGSASIKTGVFAGVKSKRDIYDGDYKTECEFLTDVLVKNGVPAGAVFREDKSSFTKENAVFSRNIADENGLRVKKAILVCKNFHARRALMYYQLAFPEAVFFVQPVPYIQDGVSLEKNNWYMFEGGIKRVTGEMARIGTQFEREFSLLSRLNGQK